MLAFPHSARRPALGNGLTPSVKTQRIRTMCSQVSKQGSFPATKTVVSYWHWQGYIDTDHTYFNMIGEITCCFTIASEDCDAFGFEGEADEEDWIGGEPRAHDAVVLSS